MPELIGPWQLGITTLLGDAAVRPSGSGQQLGVLDADNAQLEEDGTWVRRAGLTLTASDNIHSLWSDPLHGAFAVVNGDLSSVMSDGSTLSHTSLHTLASDEAVSFTVVADAVVYSTQSEIGKIKDGVVTPLGVETPSGFFPVANVTGSLPPGTYHVAISYRAGGEEGALSPTLPVKLATTGSITFVLPTPSEPETTHIRLFRTGPDGEVLYHIRDVTAGTTSTTVTDLNELGAVSVTRGLQRMVPGVVRYWRGRLITVRGHLLQVSEPLMYGLCSLVNGFVQMAERITFVEPVAGGIFLGTSRGVKFLAGSEPKEWKLLNVDSNKPQAWSSTKVPVSAINLDLDGTEDDVAVWLSTAGFVLGLPNGQVVRPQAGVLEVAISEAGATYFDNGYVVALQQ